MFADMFKRLLCSPLQRLKICVKIKLTMTEMFPSNSVHLKNYLCLTTAFYMTVIVK